MCDVSVYSLVLHRCDSRLSSICIVVRANDDVRFVECSVVLYIRSQVWRRVSFSCHQKAKSKNIKKKQGAQVPFHERKIKEHTSFY